MFIICLFSVEFILKKRKNDILVDLKYIEIMYKECWKYIFPFLTGITLLHETKSCLNKWNDEFDSKFMLRVVSIESIFETG